MQAIELYHFEDDATSMSSSGGRLHFEKELRDPSGSTRSSRSINAKHTSATLAETFSSTEEGQFRSFGGPNYFEGRQDGNSFPNEDLHRDNLDNGDETWTLTSDVSPVSGGSRTLNTNLEGIKFCPGDTGYQDEAGYHHIRENGAYHTIQEETVYQHGNSYQARAIYPETTYHDDPIYQDDVGYQEEQAYQDATTQHYYDDHTIDTQGASFLSHAAHERQADYRERMPHSAPQRSTSARRETRRDSSVSPVQSFAPSDSGSSWEGSACSASREVSLLESAETRDEDDTYYEDDSSEDDGRPGPFTGVLHNMKCVAGAQSSSYDDDTYTEFEFLPPVNSSNSGRPSRERSHPRSSRNSRLAHDAQTLFSRAAAIGGELLRGGDSDEERSRRRESRGGRKKNHHRRRHDKDPAGKIMQSLSNIFSCGAPTNY